ncbi:tripartite tricarboxylate transporter substrate binding protein [Achromobacter animicus]|uniref:Bug family tripartite tricarboxylate transporter substrate binding protein n=1 Tax=Achromobacter animicus TaxID=1389935 RepID=UPI0028A5A113|nr:tripartite tricarboxylate transporter substrate binding protein [Achromobacter animicus]
MVAESTDGCSIHFLWVNDKEPAMPFTLRRRSPLRLPPLQTFRLSIRPPFRLLLGSAALTALCSFSAAAQTDYPTKPVRLVVPYPPGAATDAISRAFAQQLGTIMGQPVVVENRPGTGSAIGITAVKGRPADGYTLLVHAEGFYSAKLTTPGAAYAFSDFEILAPLGQSSYAFIVPADRGWNRLEDLKEAKRELDIGIADLGVGTYSTLAARLASGLQTQYRPIPFKGGAEGLTAILGGQIDGYFTTIGTTQNVKDNPHVKVLAYTGRPGSTSHLPGVKTFAELGVPDMVFHSSYSVAVRTGIPEPVRDRLAGFVRQAVASEEMNKARRDLYLDEYSGSLDEYKQELLGLAAEFQASARARKAE